MDNLNKAKKRAMDLLLDRDHTEKELYDKLIRKGFTEEESAKALSYVKGFGYVNDERYVRHYIEFYRESRSLTRIKFDLMKKGVDGDLIREALDEFDEFDQKPLIETLALKKWRSLKTDDASSKEKVFAFLARKGFRPSDIRSVLDNLTRS